MIIVPILTTSLIHFILKCWENVLFEPGSDGVKACSGFVTKLKQGLRHKSYNCKMSYHAQPCSEPSRLVYTYDASTSISHVRTGTTQAQAQARVPFSCACACVVPAYTWLMLVLASSRFTRGLCLCLRRTCKPAFSERVFVPLVSDVSARHDGHVRG